MPANSNCCDFTGWYRGALVSGARWTGSRWNRAARLTGCALVAGNISARADSLDAIPLPAGGYAGSASAISADGSTVVGSYIDSNNYTAAFYWPGTGTASDLGALGSPSGGTAANAVSADGSVVVGTSGSQAFRWTAGGGMTPIPLLSGGFYSSGFGVSGDGAIVVGQSQNGAGWREAFYWTSGTGSVGLGTLDSGPNIFAESSANAISANGQVIVGFTSSDAYPDSHEAFRWKAGTMTGLGTLNGSGIGTYSVAKAVNADGSVIVGQSSSNTVVNPIFGVSGEAFRWTQGGGMVGLGAINPTDFESAALAVSADGSVVVGYSVDQTFTWQAFRWKADTGMKSVLSLLAAAGVNVTGWSLDQANGVSADGNTIVGSGTDPNGDGQAWIARFSPVFGPGLITPEIVARSFAGLAALPQAGNGRLDAQLGVQAELAANHNCGACAFAYGTGGTVPGDPFGAGALGAKRDLAPNVAIGASVGAQYGQTGLVYNGSVRSTGGLASAFAAYTPERGLQLLGAVTAERVSADITRGYLNGNSPASSSGSTNGYGFGGLLRAGWAFTPAPMLRVTPFASYSATRVHFDGWTETTGVFPARFDAIDQTAQMVRLGGDVRYTWAPGTWAFGGLNWAHRIDNMPATVSGSLIGLFSLNVPGAVLDRDYLETTIGLRLPLGPAGAVSASGSVVASANNPATFLGRVIVSQAF